MFEQCVRTVGVGLAVVVASGLASAGVTVLDKPQLGVFATIQAAITAADHGDVLLVEPGTYTGFTIDNKALTVLATGTVTVNGTSKVLNLTANRSVSLVGMSLLAADHQYGKLSGLELTNDLGNVRVQGCTLKGSRYYHQLWGPWSVGHGALVTSSLRVIFTQCILRGRDVGADGGGQATAGGDGLNMTDSSVALYDCNLKGGEGSIETYPSGGKGGAACRVTNYGVYASAGIFTGGRGGGGDYYGCSTAGDGGDALVLTDAQAQLLSPLLTPGLAAYFYTCTPGVNGQQIVSNGGVVNTLTGTRRKMTAPAITNDNTMMPFVFSGEPGDNVWLLFGKKPAFLFVAGLNGVVAIPNPWFASMVPVGVIDATGTLNFNFVIGDVQGASEGWMRHVQGFIRGPSGSFLTAPLEFLLKNT